MIREKTFEEIIKSMSNYLRDSNLGYNADIKIGSIIREIMIDPQAFEMSVLYHYLTQVQQSQSIVFANQMSTEDLDNLVSNWFLSRKTGGYGQGYLTFNVQAKPIDGFDIVIPAGTKVSAVVALAKLKVNYVTQKTAYIRYKEQYSNYPFDTTATDGYYDNDLSAYAVMVYAVCDTVGPNGNVEAGSVSSIVTPLAGGIRVTNKFKMTGGTNAESNTQLAARQQQALKGVQLGTKDGYEARIKQNVAEVTEVYTVGPGHSKMTRDGGYGGKADYYILARPFVLEGRQEVITKVVTDSNYLGLDVVLKYQPVDSIVSVELLNNGISTGIFLKEAQLVNFNGSTYGDYELVKDTGENAGSIYGQDKIHFLSAVGINPNESLGVIYNVNRTVMSAQNYLEVTKVETDDVLAKESIEEKINIGCTIDVYQGFVAGDVRQNIINDIVSYINSTSQGSLIKQSDIVGLIQLEDGVNNIMMPLDKFMFATDALVPTAVSQINLRTVGDTEVVLSKQPVTKVTSVEWRNVDGSWVTFKQKGDVNFVQGEYILYSNVNSKIKNDITALNPLDNVYPTNNQTSFYLTHNLIRSKSGSTAVPFDIIVEGSNASVIDIVDNVVITIANPNTSDTVNPTIEVTVAKITFNFPPTSDELWKTLRVNYYYEKDAPNDFELVRDVGQNANTFNAQDKIKWLTEVDLSKGDLTTRINYTYVKLNSGDIQLDANQFVSIDSNSIDVKIRNSVPLPADTNLKGINTSSNDLFDI